MYATRESRKKEIVVG